MFSKPILIAASVASAQAALLGLPATTTNMSDTANLSDVVGCGQCLSGFSNDPMWIYGGTTSLWGTVSATVTNAITSGTGNDVLIAGGICCLAATTEETTGTNAKTYCAGAFISTQTKNTQIKYTAATYMPSALAHCPHDTTNCAAAAKKKDASVIDLTVSTIDQRYIELDDQDSYVDLTLTVNASPGTAPAMKQKTGDVCTWIVSGTCDAPVITAHADSSAFAVIASAEYKFQVTEWSEEFTAASTDAWAVADQTGPSSTKKWYPPLTANTINALIVDLKATAPALTTPNNMMGDVLFKSPDKDGTTYLKVPGNTLVEWMANIKAVYDSYTAEKTKYDAEAALWKTYAEYKKPEPGLFDWLFGATEDPDKPKTVSSPLQPTQPVDLPTTISSLAIGATTKPTSPAVYANNALSVAGQSGGGYGWPSAYMVYFIKSNTVKPWGTLAGGGINDATATASTADDLLLSVRKTANTGRTKTSTPACNKSYVMITAVKEATTVAKTFKIKVTTKAFASSLEEQIPTRPGAVTAPVAAPAGATQLAASAVAAALTALYLF